MPATPNSPVSAPRRPPVAVCREDLPELLAIAFDGLLEDPRAAAALLSEIERAKVIDDGATRPKLVLLGAEVIFRGARDAASRCVKVVSPGEARGTTEAISVLSPIGSGLIGLSEGQAILWEDRRGGYLELEVLQVSFDPREMRP